MLVLAVPALSGCGVIGAQTAYCMPGDPVITPPAAPPGAELQIAIPENPECETRMPERARYEVLVTPDILDKSQEQWHFQASLGLLDPADDGAAEGTVRLPDDIPVGGAEVSVRLQGAPTICELDPHVSCAKNPFAAIEVTG